MSFPRSFVLAVALILAGLATFQPERANAQAKPSARSAAVVLAGGCYWGVESVFRHVRGVRFVTSGFATPAADKGQATTAPAEAVRLEFDPSQISYRQILDIFFSVVHDPTQLNRQGPDVGAEYRSLVFVNDAAPRAMVRSYIDSLTSARVYPHPIVTQIVALQSFHAVDEPQQNYAEKHPTDRYIVINDAPKLRALEQRFPRLYRK
ncbi:MAG TPA: peptide-methionine (S)-S-oxide reductase MsrA [Gemmatimonadaceae bacterium]